MKLSNNKAPGENKIPIEAFKALVREDCFDIPYEMIVRYWNDPDFHIEEIQHAKLCIICKKGDKRDINTTEVYAYLTHVRKSLAHSSDLDSKKY